MRRANTTWLRSSLTSSLASLLAEDSTKTYDEGRLATPLRLSEHESREINAVHVVAIGELELTAMRRLATTVTATITRACEGAGSVRTDLSSLRTSQLRLRSSQSLRINLP